VAGQLIFWPGSLGSLGLHFLAEGSGCRHLQRHGDQPADDPPAARLGAYCSRYHRPPFGTGGSDLGCGIGFHGDLEGTSRWWWLVAAALNAARLAELVIRAVGTEASPMPRCPSRVPADRAHWLPDSRFAHARAAARPRCAGAEYRADGEGLWRVSRDAPAARQGTQMPQITRIQLEADATGITCDARTVRPSPGLDRRGRGFRL